MSSLNYQIDDNLPMENGDFYNNWSKISYRKNVYKHKKKKNEKSTSL